MSYNFYARVNSVYRNVVVFGVSPLAKALQETETDLPDWDVDEEWMSENVGSFISVCAVNQLRNDAGAEELNRWEQKILNDFNWTQNADRNMESYSETERPYLFYPSEISHYTSGDTDRLLEWAGAEAERLLSPSGNAAYDRERGLALRLPRPELIADLAQEADFAIRIEQMI